jgi:nicotinate-nucleotide pyrophosphorylase (carboxylating)
MPDINTMSLGDAYAALASTGLVTRVLDLARDEDLGAVGDVTSAVCIRSEAVGRADLVARKAGVIAGLAALPELARLFGGQISINALARDGQAVERGVRLAELAGPMRDLLALERTALNLVGRLSGIATLTASFVRAVAGTRAAIYDTRKTTPGLRMLEKYAVRCGGGRCLRIGLFDAVLIKDNHIAGIPPERLAEAVRKASLAARKQFPGLSFVEVEVDTLEQLRALLTLERGVVDIVLLDNMNTEIMRQAVAMRDSSIARPSLEASGGVTLETVGEIARTGVERISAGALTHSAAALDVALDMRP